MKPRSPRKSVSFVKPSDDKQAKPPRASWGPRLTRSRSSLDAGSENAGPEKPQVSAAPAAVLGDATNTYCTSSQQNAIASNVLPKPGQIGTHASLKPQETLVAPSPASENGRMDGVQFDNPQHVAEYVPDIFQNLQREEALHLPSPSYMDRQAAINAKMRAILVDWLVDVHKKYKLRPETLFLAVNIIDRFLDIKLVPQKTLQLVGVTALLIAAKFEEVYPPQIKEFVHVTDKAYTKEEILNMEVVMLTALQFKICRPTAINFLERYQSVNGCTDAHRDLAQYLLELTLMDYKAIKYAPSHLAAAAILLSNKLLRRPSWTPAAVRQTKMTEPMLKDCAKEICVLLECADTSPFQAVRKKFSQSKHHAVAKINFMTTSGFQAGDQAKAAKVTSARERRTSLSSGLSEAMEVC